MREVIEENVKHPKGAGDQILEALKTKDKEILKILDDLDIELFLEDVVDKKGNKVKIPKEVLDLWDIYWEHIKDKLKSKLNETN